MKLKIKQKLAKVNAHVQEYKEEYAILGLTLTVGYLTYVVLKQDEIITAQRKKLKGTTKLTMHRNDFKRMHDEGGWMVWDGNNGFGDVVLGITEVVAEMKEKKSA